ncbi:sensor histidine kinase [Fibrella sp. WM1]|uniref:sensor histidine kinase n=1 Tax=Fibrella musci TaxID=3242485 RepID=UPI0035202FE1
MQDTTRFRRFETYLLVGTVTIYIIRRLIQEINQYEGRYWSAVASQRGASVGILRQLNGYDHTLNNNVPLIGGALLVLLAWFVFHQLAYPKLQQQADDQQGWLLTGAAAGLLLVGTLVYHYLKLYVRYQHDGLDNVIGLAVYSLYRKRTVLADTIGLGILLGTYELAFQYYQFLTHRIARESAAHFRLVSYLLLSGLALMAVTFALTDALPPTLWYRGSGLRDLLIVLCLGGQILALQQYVYTQIIPLLAQPRTSESALTASIGTYLLSILLVTTALWGAATNFYFWAFDPLIVFSLIVIIGSVFIAYLRQVLNKEKVVLQTQVSAGAAELSSLRAQINPHFLFNALNSLYATALKEKADKTADGIQKLGDMMRFMLQENNRDRIPLDKEIEYLRNYIEIQRMRIDESHDIAIRVTIQEPSRSLSIAPMLLTPFVENAFKHGISLRHPSWITVTLTLDDTQLYFKVHNSRHPKPQNDPEAVHTGVGLANVRKRLELIYPGQHQLVIQQSDQDYFVALTLPFFTN